jgi:putative hydrolase of the HAD superfamily
MITTIAFDADDTLWHNERVFTSAKSRYKEILARYHQPEWVEMRLDEAEMRNIEHFGYGVKGFTLSMVETAVELTEGRVTGNEIGEILKIARRMLGTPIELLEGVRETIQSLSDSYKLMVITKGDLFDQETKIARSGLGDHFEHVEVVSSKTKETYGKFLQKKWIECRRVCDDREFSQIGYPAGPSNWLECDTHTIRDYLVSRTCRSEASE